MSPRAAPLAAPRPLQARSLATRRRLLEATIACLVELGHAGTTTPEVCRRAGVSQGALFRHFPTKAALLGAAVRHLFAQLIEDFRRGFAALADEPDRLAGALRLLRESFEQPRLLAAFDLYTAARTDPELRAGLVPVMAEHRENLRVEARRLFPGAGPRLEAAVDAVVGALQGAALGALVLPNPTGDARSLAWLEEAVRREVGDV